MATKIRWELAEEPAGQGALFAEEVERHVGRGEFRGMEFLHVRAQSIINTLPKSGFLPFRHTINAYRGCSHACTYCFARPTHGYLGLDTGRDFETKIVVKINAVERLRAELDPRRWSGEHIAMGTNTDPYQRCEGKYRLTQGIVGVLAEHGNPFSILTKSTLILRDLDRLVDAASRASVHVNLSVGTLDEDVWRATEPGTPHPARRLAAVSKLNEAGVPCGVLMGPILPGLSDAAHQLDAVVRAALDAGAVSVSSVLLHLKPGVRELFLPWLHDAHPELAERYEAMYQRAYAPKAEQRRVSATVRRLVEHHRGTRVGIGRGRALPADVAPPAPAPAPVPPAALLPEARAEQLPLL